MSRMTLAQVPDVVESEEILSATLVTHNGQRLSPKEDRFISLYIKLSDPGKAAEEAGYLIRDSYKNRDAAFRKKGLQLLSKDYIKDEIAFRMKEVRAASIADAMEIRQYLTAVMRGEVKDQFGFETSVSDRTVAAKELYRIEQTIEQAANTSNKTEVHLVLERK